MKTPQPASPVLAPGSREGGAPAGPGGPRHRLVLVDASPPGDRGAHKNVQHLKLIDADECAIVRSVEAGNLPEIAVDSTGTRIAVISYRLPNGQKKSVLHLTIYDSGTLDVIKAGELPFASKLQRFPLLDVLQVFGFSGDGKTVFVPSETDPVGETAPPLTGKRALYYVPIRWADDLVDGKFRMSEDYRVVAAPYAGFCPILGAKRWPLVEVADRKNHAIQVLDFGRGGLAEECKISGLVGAEVPARATAYPGYCFGSSDGNFAFLVPEAQNPGPIVKFDLTSGRPTVAATSARRHADLSPLFASSDGGPDGRIYVAPRLSPAPDFINIFSSKSLNLLGTIRLDRPYKSLTMSRDGSMIYVGDSSPPSVRIIDLDEPGRVRQVDGGLRWPLTAVAL